MSGIIVAFPKAQDGTAIKNLLVRNGYDVVSSCTTGAQAINLADNLGEGIIISGYRPRICCIPEYWRMLKADSRCFL